MVSILILNWNGAKYVYDCLTSIKENVKLIYEVIVVDNNSSDGSPAVIAERFPWVKLILSEDNLGFTAGNNLAANHALGKYLLLLNNDTLLQTDIVDAIQILEIDDRIGAVGAAMFGAHDEPRSSCARFPTPARLWRFSSMWFETSNPASYIGGIGVNYCDFVEGSFLMTRADCWRQLDGLDERNYMYGDDIDYCRSLFGLGFRTVQCPSVRYKHFGGYSHAKMGYLFAGFRRYHRKFSSRLVQFEADFVLRVGLIIRIPFYWLRATFKKNPTDKDALKHALSLNRNWKSTAVDAHRYHS